MQRPIAALSVALLLAGSAVAQQASLPLKLRGFALNFTGIGAGRSGDVEITIERWSSDDERERVRTALAQGGVAALSPVVFALQPRAGTIHTQRGGSIDVKFAREMAGTDGGRRLVLATDRVPPPKGSAKAESFDFLVVEVRLDKAGKGEARTAGADRLRFDKQSGAVELDRYGVEPVWVKDLKVVAAKP